MIGKYGRGEQSQWQVCNRQIAKDGTKCMSKYFHKGIKPWNQRLCTAMRKLTKEIINGTSSVLQVHVLNIDEDIINRAEGFMMHAIKHKFGSQDALIAATAIMYSTPMDPLLVVTSDKSFRAAMKAEGMLFIVPGTAVSKQNDE